MKQKLGLISICLVVLLFNSSAKITDDRALNQQFFAQKNLTYLEKIQINLPDHNLIAVKKTERYLFNPAHYDQLELKYGKQIAQGYMAPVLIKFINDKIGYGVFAQADLNVNDLVGEYTGIVIPLNTIKDTKYTWDYLSGQDQQGNKFNISLDAGTAGNEMRYVNHDYQPNTVMQYVPQGGLWHVVYVVIKPIKKGEQILTDYGRRYWAGLRGEPYQFVSADGKQVAV